MKISTRLLDLLFDQARRESPRECCGLLAVKGETVKEIYQVINRSPLELEFSMAPQDIFEAKVAIEKSGAELGGVYHSHPTGDPVLSQADILHARWWMVEWMVIGMAAQEIEARSYKVINHYVEEIPLLIS